jgi:hypothetical protein
MWPIRISVLLWGSFIGCGWSTPPSTTSGPKPYDVRLLTFSHRLFLTLAFNPETFVQKDTFCEGRYELRLSLWQAGRLLFWGERKLTLRAHSTGQPDATNLHTWPIPLTLPAYPITCTLECWDKEYHQVWIETDTIKSPAFSPLFVSYEKNLYSFSEIGMQNFVILASPAPVVEVVLYQAESSLPGLKRYLSLQEQRFVGVGSKGIDTLRLSWRKAELLPGEYLIGIYAYRGSKVVAEGFYQVVRKASPGERAG